MKDFPTEAWKSEKSRKSIVFQVQIMKNHENAWIFMEKYWIATVFRISGTRVPTSEQA
jgi:hypothetical protein